MMHSVKHWYVSYSNEYGLILYKDLTLSSSLYFLSIVSMINATIVQNSEWLRNDHGWIVSLGKGTRVHLWIKERRIYWKEHCSYKTPNLAHNTRSLNCDEMMICVDYHHCLQPSAKPDIADIIKVPFLCRHRRLAKLKQDAAMGNIMTCDMWKRIWSM